MTYAIAELRQSWRALLHQPGNSLLTVFVLALGLAGVIGMLSIIKSLVWDPLPYPNADQILTVGWRDRANSGPNLQSLDAEQFLQWQERLEGQAELAGSGSATVNLTSRDGVERYDGAYVTHNLFAMLGVAPVLGRGFTAEDDRPGAAAVVLLSNELWRNRFASAPEIVGSQVRANAQAATVIGIMPPDFSFPHREALWLPAQVTRAAGPVPDRDMDTFARPLSVDGSAAIRTTLESWLADQVVADAARWSAVEVDAEPLPMLYANRETRMILNIMLATVGLVLLVACANAANLMLARTLARSRDLALRLTLGASRGRVGLYLLAQSLMLTLLATLLALPLAQWGVDWVVAAFAGTGEDLAPWFHPGINAGMAAMAIAVAMTSALLVAALPVARLRVDSLASGLREGGRAVSAGGIGKLSRILVVAQLTMACIVLLSTLVMVRGVAGLAKTDLGINPDHLLTARVALFEQLYPADADTVDYFRKLVDELRLQPEVVAAGAGTTLPGLMGDTEQVLPEGFVAANEQGQLVRYAAVDDGFLPTYQVELRSGRAFDSRDTADSDPVAIIDERFAANLFAGADPIGRRLRIPAQGDNARWHTVIGVVENLQLEDAGDPLLPNVLVALSQSPQRFVSVVVRTRTDPELFKTRLTELIRLQDPDTPAYWLRSYDEVIRVAMVGERVVSGMFTAFGLATLVLAAAGLYGLIAQLVSQRTREIGVQRALGAPGSAVLRRLLGQTLGQVLIGLILGVALAIPFAGTIARAIPSLPADPFAVPLLIAILLTVSVVAVLMPARRALGVDPTVALRDE
ncbi:MAG: ABC transporter permease [Lysobacterales bacterium]